MKRIALTMAAVGLAASLAACNKKDAAATQTAAAAPAASGNAAATADARIVKGEGAVMAVSADSVTIDHGPIPEVSWPAMTMAFKASPEITRQVKVGDKVAFDLRLQGGGGEVTAISKRH